MRTESKKWLTLTHLKHGASLQHIAIDDPQPFSRQSELIGQAFAASKVVRLMNRIIGGQLERRANAYHSDSFAVAAGIRLLERLLEGVAYLDRTENFLIPPATTETVKQMQAQGVSNIRTRTENILPYLRDLKDCLGEGEMAGLSDLGQGMAEETRVLFREIHASIGDQLRITSPPAESPRQSHRPAE